MNLDKRCYDFPDCKNCPLNHTTICLVATHQMHLTFNGVIKNITAYTYQQDGRELIKDVPVPDGLIG